MKLGALAGGICRICGSDTMGSDIGCTCMGKYKQAAFIVLRNDDKASLEYNYSLEMRVIMGLFCAEHEESLARHNGDVNKAYKTAFNRSFYPSVYSFYKEKGYVSKKQLGIVHKRLAYSPDKEEAIYNETEKAKEAFLKDFERQHDGQIVEVARNLWKAK